MFLYTFHLTGVQELFTIDSAGISFDLPNKYTVKIKRRCFYEN